jgi:hypothetical protein
MSNISSKQCIQLDKARYSSNVQLDSARYQNTQSTNLSKKETTVSSEISFNNCNKSQKLNNNKLILNNAFDNFLTFFTGCPKNTAFEFTKFIQNEIANQQMSLDISGYEVKNQNRYNGWKIETVLARENKGFPVTVVAFIWGKGQFCEIHGHKNDCGFIRGVSEESKDDILFDREYELDNHGLLIEKERLIIGNGSCRLYNPEAHAIHRMEAPITNNKNVVSFHFYARAEHENGAIDLLQIQAKDKPLITRLSSYKLSIAKNQHDKPLSTGCNDHWIDSEKEVRKPHNLKRSGDSTIY